MELGIYTALRTQIETHLGDRIKHVRLFNNQFERSNDDKGGVENAFPYPCVFLQFSDKSFKDLLKGVQQVEMTLTTHLGFESYKTEDTEILQLKQDLYVIVQRFVTGYFDKVTRTSEIQDFDHSNIQVYRTEYRVAGKDYDKDTRATIQVTPTLTLSATTIQLSAITN